MAGEQIAVAMHGRLRCARGARGVEPKGHGVPAHPLDLQRSRVGRLYQLLEGHRPGPAALIEGHREPAVRHEHLGPAVVENEVEVLHGKARVERHRHRAQPEGGEEGDGEADAVRHEEGHSLLGLHAELPEGSGHPAGERGQLVVSAGATGSHEGRTRAEPLGERLVHEDRHGIVYGEVSHARVRVSQRGPRVSRPPMLDNGRALR